MILRVADGSCGYRRGWTCPWRSIAGLAAGRRERSAVASLTSIGILEPGDDVVPLSTHLPQHSRAGVEPTRLTRNSTSLPRIHPESPTA